MKLRTIANIDDDLEVNRIILLDASPEERLTIIALIDRLLDERLKLTDHIE